MSLFKKPGLAVLGSIFLVVGLIMVLVWWPNVVILFKGGGGIVLAIAGLILLSSLKNFK